MRCSEATKENKSKKEQKSSLRKYKMRRSILFIFNLTSCDPEFATIDVLLKVDEMTHSQTKSKREKKVSFLVNLLLDCK